MQTAAFAVVGHPNKGKSSIVSTLAHNDSVQISSRSGTTTESCRYRVDTGKSSYQLIDTPGFQRPGKVLHWLQQHADSASQRKQAVADFVADSTCRQRFPDEVALLTPITEGAAILYVIDGSRPYGAEYEAEMEILRWTGQPSMALINPIENESHINEWSNALGQFFKTVRVFNPLQADFDKQTDLLNTFTHLNPEWADNLKQVVADLTGRREQQRQISALILARLVDDLCNYQFCRKVLNEVQAASLETTLKSRYLHWMKSREEKAVTELLANYAHFHTNISIEQLNLPPDLFDCDKWFAWGLNKKQLLSAAALSGAATGAAVDIALAGHSLMLVTLGGGLLGFGSAWLGAGKLADIKLKGLPLGGYQACYGPIHQRNFPYVVIGRFLHLYHQISLRNHANRQTLNLSADDFQQQVADLEKSHQKQLHRACARLIKQKPVDDLDQLLLPLF
jgi:GTPase Era involved in 16S rRNA processing